MEEDTEKRVSPWRPFSRFAVQMLLAEDAELEFLACRDSAHDEIRCGDIVRGRPLMMSQDLFSHWRPIASGNL